MDVEVESKSPAKSASSSSLDLTGLPPSVVTELKGLVTALRENLAPGFSPEGEEPYEAWEGRLNAWANSHPARSVFIDDSREGLYSGRGE